jgi:hypothetical protein
LGTLSEKKSRDLEDISERETKPNHSSKREKFYIALLLSWLFAKILPYKKQIIKE